ncbi:MAG TPA: hypothetical protein VFZ09_21240 [Archangium sp.]|uniref:hypothetical protein n=1 Tax=Archangium sp. TaxID=1872627 RepID=UPI002E350DEE|nr:hypothetical protein [Archangium sp.]HEX5748780.1 hypothetical protein [Archangium sp.]
MAAEQGASTQEKLAMIRGSAVMLGPAVVVDGLLAASVLAASAAAWEQGRRSGRLLWKLAAVGALTPWVYRLFLRSSMMRLGATRQEEQQSLPGDELIPDRRATELTHALTLRARPEDIWPWLVQIGSGERGGFYSYDWLERLAGAPVHSVDRILPEYQQPKVGDLINPDGSWRVLRVDPGRAFVFGDKDFVWALVVQPVDEERSRLLVRFRVSPRQAGPFASGLIVLPHLLMQKKMMKGLRRRIERAARQREAGGAMTPGMARPVSEQSPAPGL